MKKLLLFVMVPVLISFNSCEQKTGTVAPGELNFQSMIQPIPVSAKFINDSLYIWGGTLVKSHIDQQYHLFYSRWPRQHGFSAWVTSSEIFENGKPVALLSR